MAVRLHHVVEGHLEDDLRIDGAKVSIVFTRVGFEPGSEVSDLAVGEAGVGLADVEQAELVVSRAESGRVRISRRRADSKSVIRENAGALAVSKLNAGHDNIQCGEFALQFEPGFAAASG